MFFRYWRNKTWRNGKKNWKWRRMPQIVWSWNRPKLRRNFDHDDNTDAMSFTNIDVDKALNGFQSEAQHSNISDMFVCDHYVDLNCCCECFKKKALLNPKKNGKACSVISTEREGNDYVATIHDSCPRDDSEKLTRIKPKTRDVSNHSGKNGESDEQHSLPASSESKREETIETEETTDGEDDTSTVLSQLSITDNSEPSQEEPNVNSQLQYWLLRVDERKTKMKKSCVNLGIVRSFPFWLGLMRFVISLPTAYEMGDNSFTLFVSPHLPRGVPRPGPASRGGGGVAHLGYPPPSRTWLGDPPCWGEGTPPRVPPLPHRTWLGVSHLGYPLPVRPDRGGTPPRVPPPPPQLDLARGGIPLRETDWILDTPRSVCLLRSRRRTFLYSIYILNYLHLMYQITQWQILYQFLYHTINVNPKHCVRYSWYWASFPLIKFSVKHKVGIIVELVINKNCINFNSFSDTTFQLFLAEKNSNTGFDLVIKVKESFVLLRLNYEVNLNHLRSRLHLAIAMTLWYRVRSCTVTYSICDCNMAGRSLCEQFKSDVAAILQSQSLYVNGL